jgi:hypothetical protein
VVVVRVKQLQHDLATLPSPLPRPLALEMPACPSCDWIAETESKDPPCTHDKSATPSRASPSDAFRGAMLALTLVDPLDYPEVEAAFLLLSTSCIQEAKDTPGQDAAELALMLQCDGAIQGELARRMLQDCVTKSKGEADASFPMVRRALKLLDSSQARYKAARDVATLSPHPFLPPGTSVPEMVEALEQLAHALTSSPSS